MVDGVSLADRSARAARSPDGSAAHRTPTTPVRSGRSQRRHVTLGIALLAYGLATVDRARGPPPTCVPRRLGVPAGLLRGVEGAQNLIPLVAAVVVATGLGLLFTAAYPHTGDQGCSPRVGMALIGLVLVGGALSPAPPCR